MRETWVRSNTRAVAVGLVLPALLLIAGLVCLLFFGTPVVKWLGIGIIVAAGLLTITLLWLMRLPRLGYEDGWLLVYLSSTMPERVPIDVVECFFLGQSLSLVVPGRKAAVPARAIVVRLAESAAEWQNRPTRPALGEWSQGYITLGGTWCEPIHPRLLQRLNERLVEIQRARREATAKERA
jgi:hypothetical protein